MAAVRASTTRAAGRLMRLWLANERPSRVAAQGLQLCLLVFVCLYVGHLASSGHIGREIAAFALLAALGAALVVPPHVFVALALLVFGSLSISRDHPIAFGGTSVYSTDVLLFVVLLRAALRRPRMRPFARLDSLARAAFVVWALVMLFAGFRSLLSGSNLVSVVRLEMPLIYGVGFYVGLGRIMRESEFRFDRAIRNLLVVALGFIGWAALMRAMNQPFETTETVGRLGQVITTQGSFRRDYGFESAFILYPALALAAAAYLLFNPRRPALAAVVVSIGTIATLLTLIRGAIFGLFVGLATIGLLRNQSAVKRVARMRGIVAGVLTLLVASITLWALNPAIAATVLERSLPGIIEQSRTAESTAAYRREAILAGFDAAGRAPAGYGLVPAEELTLTTGVELGHLAHSGITTILVYTGWIGLAAAAFVLGGLLCASFRAPRPEPWLHAFFVGSFVMLAVYTDRKSVV